MKVENHGSKFLLHLFIWLKYYFLWFEIIWGLFHFFYARSEANSISTETNKLAFLKIWITLKLCSGHAAALGFEQHFFGSIIHSPRPVKKSIARHMISSQSFSSRSNRSLFLCKKDRQSDNFVCRQIEWYISLINRIRVQWNSIFADKLSLLCQLSLASLVKVFR